MRPLSWTRPIAGALCATIATVKLNGDLWTYFAILLFLMVLAPSTRY